MTRNEEKLFDKDQARDKIRQRYQETDTENVEVIPAKPPEEDIFNTDKEQRVGIYARVSTDGLSQVSSYELQIAHYGDMVQQRDNWELVDIYADEGISGTSLEHRDEFIRMIDDCKQGKIDLIVTKSVSRFARNIVDCIGTVRMLRSLSHPVGVYFESENIYTLRPDYEMMLSFSSSMAQEESHIKSKTMNTSYEMRFKRGIYLTPELYGYDHDEDGKLVVNEEEAKAVRLMYYLYLYGYGCTYIANELTRLGVVNPSGKKVWSNSTVTGILRNERHCGDLLVHKTWTPDYLNHKARKNNGDKPQYYKKDHHEAIVSREDYVAVQTLLDMSRHGYINITPELRVISSGVLKGFVCVNPRWNRYGKDDYIEAALKVKKRFKCLDELRVAVEPGEVDMSEYEVVRGEFLGGRTPVTMTFKDNEVRFSLPAIKMMDVSNIEMLIEPLGGYLAVRKGMEDDSHSICWCGKKMGKTVKKSVTIPGFVNAVYELFSWNRKLTYRINGVFLEKDNERVLFFDVRHTEILIPKHYATVKEYYGQNIPRGSIVAYKKEWADSYGDSYYGNRFLSPVNVFENTEKWDIGHKSIVALEPKIRIRNREELKEDIDNLMEDIYGDNTGKDSNEGAGGA